jgi:putative SOS response-associated peptidase YedK
VDRLLLRGCGACQEIPHEIWRRTIQSEGPRPWFELGAVVQYCRVCGRFTRNYTWEQIHALYRLTAPAAIPNLQPRFDACPTDPADTIVEHEGKRDLVEMRWGLVPFWWNKPLKELRLATFNARVETVTTKPFFREPFKNKRCLVPVSGYFEWQDTPKGKQPLVFHGA